MTNEEFGETYVTKMLGAVVETFPHVVAIYDLPKVLMITGRFDGKNPAADWLWERGSHNLDWIQTDLGIFEGGPYVVAFKDPDLAFEFKMRWA